MAYKFNGKNITALNRLVLEVVKKYVSEHPEISYIQLKNIFKDEIGGSRGIIKNQKDFDDWKQSIKDPEKRFFIRDDEAIKLKDDLIYVNQGWGDDWLDKKTKKRKEGNKKRFLEFAKNELYYNIDIDNLDEEENRLEVEEEIQSILEIKNIILYGAPGVGKTHNYKNIIAMIEEGKNQKEIFDTVSKNLHVDLNNEIFESIKKEKRVEFVTFHQSYSYEDFIEGFRPNESGGIKLKDGIFKKLCSDADKSDKNFYIVIDEINRGNISKIFGELITLIEEDKRDVYEVTLPYSKESFKVPSNLYIIATMNSTDKSIATIDIALRRRFTFLKMKPNEDLVSHVEAKSLFNALNSFIKDKLSEDYMLGHSYFMNVKSDEDLVFVKEYKIKPLLEEYFYADEENLKKAIGVLNKEHGNE